MNELVQRLTTPQRVEIGTRLSDPLEDLRGQVERGYVFVKFTETRGGTELGVRVDEAESDFSALSTGEGTITVVGALVLNYVSVRARASIRLPTLEGEGSLEILREMTPAELAADRAKA